MWNILWIVFIWWAEPPEERYADGGVTWFHLPFHRGVGGRCWKENKTQTCPLIFFNTLQFTKHNTKYLIWTLKQHPYFPVKTLGLRERGLVPSMAKKRQSCTHTEVLWTPGATKPQPFELPSPNICPMKSIISRLFDMGSKIQNSPVWHLPIH